MLSQALPQRNCFGPISVGHELKSVAAKRLESSNAKKEGAKTTAIDAFAVLLGEPAPDAAQVAFEDDEVIDANKGLTVMVVLFAHWSEGKRVALLLNVISAHCLVRKSASAHHFRPLRYPHCITLHHF